MEVSFPTTGQFLGVDTDVGTYTSRMRADGTMDVSGRAITMVTDGSVATWEGYGVGRPTGEGRAVSSRGAVCYSTTSETLAGPNGVAAVFDFEADAEGNASVVLWEWS